MPTCMRQQWPLHGDGQFASLQHLPTELWMQPTNRAVKLSRPVGPRYKHVLK